MNGLERIVCIDGGASKTEVYLHLPKKRFLKTYIGMNIHDSYVSHVERFIDGIVNLFGEGLYVVGVAGLDTERDIETWREMLDRHNIKYILLHDVEMALYAGSMTEEGAVVIAGTGSNVYVKKNDVEVKMGDWGYKYGDDFSAYRVGHRMINLFLRMYDGRDDRTQLYEYILDKVGNDPVEAIYTLTPYEVAAIGVETCRLGFREAVEAARKAAFEAGYTVYKALSKAGGYEGEVHYTGGLFKCGVFRRAFIRYLIYYGLNIGRYVEHPVIGGLFPALKNKGIDYKRQMIEAEVFIKSVYRD